MKYNDKLIEKVNDFYKTKKSERYSISTYLEDRLYSNETYLNLENKIRKLKFNLSKASYENDFELKRKLESELVVLLEEKSKLYDKIAQNIKINYSCNLCKDSGFYKNKRCKCYYNILTKLTLESLNIKERNLPSFNSNVPENLTKHYEKLKLYATKFPNTEIKNFVFLGKVGAGKTHLAGCVASLIKTREYLPVFLTATELNSIFLRMHKQEVDRELVFDILTASDMLIIDDLGTEPLYNNVTAEYLLSVISERLDKNKHFIITTNLSADELLSRYNERFLSRISNKTQTAIISFNGNDLRKTTKK